MVKIHFSDSPSATTSARLAELVGPLSLAGLAPNDGACWLTDTSGRMISIAYAELNDEEIERAVVQRLTPHDAHRLGLDRGFHGARHLIPSVQP